MTNLSSQSNTESIKHLIVTPDIVSAFELHRILSIAEVSKLLGRSKSMLYLDMDPKSKYFKADFPKPIKLSSRSIGWRAADVYKYINSLNQQGSKNV